MMEMSLTIKCGECITIDSMDIKRYFDNELSISDSINDGHYPRFEAKQADSDMLYVKCRNCGYEEVLNI